jgi:hypothetical protein
MYVIKKALKEYALGLALIAELYCSTRTVLFAPFVHAAKNSVSDSLIS